MPAKPETILREIEDILEKAAVWGGATLEERLHEADHVNLREGAKRILGLVRREQGAHADAAGLIRFKSAFKVAQDGPELRGFDVDGLGVFALVAPRRGKLGYQIYHIPSGYRFPVGDRPRAIALEIARQAISEYSDRAELLTVGIQIKRWPISFVEWARELHHASGPYVPYREWTAGRRAKGA